jgi:MinD superfamily P-loop ATPase
MMQIAIISGKGGTGKSSLSAAFATLEKHVVLADCDVDAANLHIIFNPEHEEETIFTGSKKAVINQEICIGCGLCEQYCRFDAIHRKNGNYIVSETTCDGCRLCARICPVEAISMTDNNQSRIYTGAFRYGRMVYGRLAPGEENSGKMVNIIREKVKEQAANFKIPMIILDGSPGIGCPVVSTITGVDVVVIVTEPTISGISDLKRAMEITSKFNLKSKIIINKSDLNPEKSIEIEKLCQNSGIEIAGQLPFDKVITEAMVNCNSVAEWAPNSQFTGILKKIWERIKKTD